MNNFPRPLRLSIDIDVQDHVRLLRLAIDAHPHRFMEKDFHVVAELDQSLVAYSRGDVISSCFADAWSQLGRKVYEVLCRREAVL